MSTRKLCFKRTSFDITQSCSFNIIGFSRNTELHNIIDWLKLIYYFLLLVPIFFLFIKLCSLPTKRLNLLSQIFDTFPYGIQIFQFQCPLNIPKTHIFLRNHWIVFINGDLLQRLFHLFNLTIHLISLN